MTKKVRVLQLIDTLDNGGAEALQGTFAASFDRTRFDLHIGVLRSVDGSLILPALHALGVPVTVFQHRTAYDLPALVRLVRYIRRHRIDLIHTHLQAADIAGRLAGFLTQRPVISTIHNGRRDLEEEPRRRQWLERWTARLWCRRLVVVSETLRAEVAAWFGLPPSRVFTIANGVDTARFQPGPAFDRAAVKHALIGSAGPLITSVGRMTEQKAQHDLIAAARIVATARPEVRFALVGAGPLAAELAAQAAALGLADQVVFTGLRPDVAEILAASDVFVLSSRWEGLPLALLEAMAAGCPVVATAVGGVPQLVQHGQTGLLVPPADAPALAAAILTCVTNPARAWQFGAAGQARVIAEYGRQAWARKWERLYLAELGDRRSYGGADSCAGTHRLYGA